MPCERGSRHRGAPAPSRERRLPTHRGLRGVPFSYVGPSFERWQELVDLVDRDGKADADAAVNGALDRVVDTDDLALCVDERPARIPRIDRGVGLDQVGAGSRGGLADVR